MVDFHTHILPGIDDGSKDIEMTEAMLEEEARQGVTAICATPHFYAQRMSFDSFLENRRHAAEITAELLDRRNETAGAASGYIDNGASRGGGTGRPADEVTEDEPAGYSAGLILPKIYTGAEVYYFQGMGRAERVKELCVTGTSTILVEMPFAQWDRQVFDDISDLIKKQRLTVVIAHIERYYEFQKDKSVWDEVFGLPVTRQINAGSFLRGWLGSRFAIKAKKAHPSTIIGTDCHNMDKRKPNLKEAREVIAKKIGQDALDESDARVRMLLDRAVDIQDEAYYK